MEALGLCESTAGRHIAAARVCRNHPEVFTLVASGVLHASALSLLKKHLTLENAGELFELCKRSSARKVEELLAARFPRPDVRDLVRRLPAQTGLTLDVGSASDKVPTEESSREPQKAVVESPSREPSVALGAAESPKPRRLEPLSADRYGVHFTADSEFRELLERVRGLAGHRLPSGDLMTLIRRGLEAYERELTKERFGVGRKPLRSEVCHPCPLRPPRPIARRPLRPLRPPRPIARRLIAPLAIGASLRARRPSHPNPIVGHTRTRTEGVTIQPRLRAAVFLRDGQQCSYVSPMGDGVARVGVWSSTT